MKVDETHPEYANLISRSTKVDDFLLGQSHVKDKDVAYLPKTGGMIANDGDGTRYANFKLRARVPTITRKAQTGIMGLMFQKPPVGDLKEEVTNDNSNVLDLSRDCARNVLANSRYILVNEAPADGGEPYITKYPSSNLINWKTDENLNLTLAVFKEEIESGDMFSHAYSDQYRVYFTDGFNTTVELYNEDGDKLEESFSMVGRTVQDIVTIIGSIDLMPTIDPIPLEPIMECAESIYLKSADYEQMIHLSSQPTLWQSGVSEDQYRANTAIGIGSSASWFLGDDGKCGLLEFTGEGADKALESINAQYDLAEIHTATLTTEANESATAIRTKAASQYATIYTIADSISAGINKALEVLYQMKGAGTPEHFKINTDYSFDASDPQMLTAITAGINSGTTPQSAMNNYLRETKLTNLTDEEIQTEIDTQMTGLESAS